jgi:hypothetical protein
MAQTETLDRVDSIDLPVTDFMTKDVATLDRNQTPMVASSAW